MTNVSCLNDYNIVEQHNKSLCLFLLYLQMVYLTIQLILDYGCINLLLSLTPPK